ncbi:hypothetical protein [Lysobacter sp. GCM10012299]|uniref:hypothetical protein n=1 Tax=Lysobacter sp. GCM10012299 TaxID=3317333 RepID=UPI00360CD454
MTVIYSVKAHHSKCGLGNTRVRSAVIVSTGDGSELAATLASSTGIGSASCVNRAFMEALSKSTPDVSELDGEALSIGRTLQAFSSLESLLVRGRQGYSQREGWQHCVIPHERYGWAYVPKGSADTLMRLEDEMPADLVATHVLCDVLGTKHDLLRKLGMDDALKLDAHLIASSLSLATEKRS